MSAAATPPRRIGVLGAAGRMGQMLVRQIGETEEPRCLAPTYGEVSCLRQRPGEREAQNALLLDAQPQRLRVLLVEAGPTIGRELRLLQLAGATQRESLGPPHLRIRRMGAS